MGSTLTLAQTTAYRKYKTDGVPSTGFNDPVKSEIIAVFADADARLIALENSLTSDSIAEPTWAALSGVTGTGAGQKAEVYNDLGTHTDPVSNTTHTVTITIASPGVLTWASHALRIGTIITLSTTGALPTGLAAATPYYIVAGGYGTNTFELAATAGGTAIVTTGSQSGTHTAVATVPNTGVYEWSTSPAGWEWISPDALSAKANASDLVAETAARIAADALLAPLSSPALTDRPTVPTPPTADVGDSTSADSTLAINVAFAAKVVAFLEAIAGSAGNAPAYPITAGVDASDITTLSGQVISRLETVFAWMLGNAAFRDIAQAMPFGDVVALAASGTNYYGLGRSSTTLGRAAWVADRTGVLRRHFAYVDIAPGSGKNIVCVLMKNGSTTAATCTISGTGTTASDILNEVSFVAGDTLEWRAVSDAGAATNNTLSVTSSMGI